MKANEERAAYITNSESLVTHIADLHSAVKLIADLRSDQPPLPLRVDPAEILTRTEYHSVDFNEGRGQISAK